MNTTIDTNVKQLISLNKMVKQIYLEFNTKYQDILLSFVNTWVKNNNYNEKLLKEYIEELINEYSVYQSVTNKWNNIKKINIKEFDNC